MYFDDSFSLRCLQHPVGPTYHKEIPSGQWGAQRSNQSSVLTPLEIKPCSPNWVRLQCPLHWAQDGSLKGCERTSDLQKKLPLGPARAPAPGEDFGGCWAGAQRARCPLEAGSHRCWHHARAPGDSQDSFPMPGWTVTRVCIQERYSVPHREWVTHVQQ